MSIKILTKLYSKKLSLIMHLNTYAVAVDCRSTAFGILQLKLDQRVQVLYGMNFARGVVLLLIVSEISSRSKYGQNYRTVDSTLFRLATSK